jgi:exopolyphosphatase/guanosine-5'-triphosphate,3'-diphosphate pyrophosphatase
MSGGQALSGAKFAVVDIGSNTAKTSVYVCFPGHGPVALEHDADTVRIGYRVAETGRISADRLERLIETLLRFEDAARRLGATTFTGIATQAFRIAENAGDALEAIQSRTSWRIRIVGADEEIRLTAAGVRRWLAPGDPSVIADIGGASTELIVIDDEGSVTASGSIPIGSGLLFDRAIATSPPPAGSVDHARKLALEAIDAAGILADKTGSLLLPGGTGQFLSMLLAHISPGIAFDPGALPALNRWLSTRSAAETMAVIPVQVDRAQVLPASLAVVEALVLRCAPQRLVAVPSGIRDAMAEERCPPTSSSDYP